MMFEIQRFGAFALKTLSVSECVFRLMTAQAGAERHVQKDETEVLPNSKPQILFAMNTVATIKLHQHFRDLCIALNLDFVGQKWTTQRGVIIDKCVDSKLFSRVVAASFSSSQTGSRLESWNEPWYRITIMTSKGAAKIAVSKQAYACMEKRDPIAIDVKVSRLDPRRVRMRLIQADKYKTEF